VRDSGGDGNIDTKRGRNLQSLHPKVSLLYAPLSIFVNLKNHWYLLSNMVKRNLNQRYNKALLGYVWTLLEPALLAGVYYILFIIIADYKDQNLSDANSIGCYRLEPVCKGTERYCCITIQ
jgi:hypothetical protein